MSVASPETPALAARYREVRQASERLAAPLSAEDCQGQSMPCASPVKWHLAHTTWFFEEFVLDPFLPGFERWHDRGAYLFNSYYNHVGGRIARGERGLMTRPSLDEVRAFRAHVDACMERVLGDEALLRQAGDRIELGLQHEQQHQELILTDVKHLLAQNPLFPAYRSTDESCEANADAAPPMRWVSHAGGLVEIGHSGDGFAFDNESPKHLRYLEPFAAASRLVTCGEYLRFMEDGGYAQPALWLSDGWDAVQRCGWAAPEYWVQRDGQWLTFTLAGLRPVDPAEPVCHVSYFEADAFARWAGNRLLREEEWEHASRRCGLAGNFVEAEHLHPRPAPLLGTGDDAMQQMFGDVWEWTQSQYTAYPGYQPPDGALGEYNGKFMCNQFVLRGGSCATPRSHIRPTYRNFFPPEARWQFTGVRLAAV
jgi:ergothioneine biosynthesis protein EgtB